VGSDDPLVSCVGLRKHYGDRAVVDGVAFTIHRGETYGLLGPNGAGKTTTISMLCGLLARDGGTVVVGGHDLDADPMAVKRAIGYVPQDVALYPDLSGRGNLRFFGRLYGLRGADLSARVDETLALVGLADRGDDRVEGYSGGMKRRLNIGAGLLHGPQLLVLDEPTVGVDPQSRNAILEAVQQLGAQGMGVLYTTHYMEEAERLCDRIGILDEGKVVAEGTRDELVALVGEQDRVRLAATGEVAVLAAEARRIEGVVEATPSDGGLTLLVHDASRLLPRLLQAAVDAGVAVQSVEVEEPDLEAVFLHLTGKALRDR